MSVTYSTWTEEIQERQFVKEKETSRLGWNDVQVWNQPCTDKSSSLGLEKGLFTAPMFPMWVEKPYSLPCVGEKRRLKLMMFSEAKLSNVAPSSASCEKQRGETGISQITPRKLRSLKPDPAEE